MILGADTPGRRTRVDYSGSIFQYSPVAAGRSEWGYNDRNEVTAAYRYSPGGVETTAMRRAYAYDPISNRHSLTEAVGAAQYYCTNEVNQYQTRDDTQTCPPSAPVDETFAYDEDGNLTQDGSITYTWDAENRLASAAPTAPVSGSKKLEFKYDYRGRRVQKQVSTYNGSTWGLSSTERYVYDAWNVVLTLDGNNAVTRKFTWGLDLSGTLHGAGGIGGLLAAKVGPANYWYFYDGNGNVTQVVSPPGGIGIMIPQPPDGVQAHYEYDPYGNILASTGHFAAANPFRFSTKWCDYELGTGKELYYYGYRYYSPRLGRWLSRDPIGERGGWNLYQSCRNDPILRIDPLGTSPYDAAKALLEEARKVHSGRLYYTAAGVNTTFDQLRWALDQISVAYTFGLLNEASYYDVKDELRIKEGTTDGLTVIHELVHALDDKKDWYITTWSSTEPAEALAYGTEELLRRANGSLSNLDDIPIQDCRKARQYWHAGWSQMNRIFSAQIQWTEWRWPHRRKITPADVRDVSSKIGLTFSCSALKPIYEKALADKGITYDATNDLIMWGRSDMVGGTVRCPCLLTCDFPDFTLD